LLRSHEMAQLKNLPLFSEMKVESLESLLDAALLQQCGREIVIERKELLEAFARPQRLIDDPMS
jgi:hypothetical protein